MTPIGAAMSARPTTTSTRCRLILLRHLPHPARTLVPHLRGTRCRQDPRSRGRASAGVVNGGDTRYPRPSSAGGWVVLGSLRLAADGRTWSCSSENQPVEPARRSPSGKSLPCFGGDIAKSPSNGIRRTWAYRSNSLARPADHYITEAETQASGRSGGPSRARQPAQKRAYA
jgi:hypothetical protein